VRHANLDPEVIRSRASTLRPPTSPPPFVGIPAPLSPLISSGPTVREGEEIAALLRGHQLFECHDILGDSHLSDLTAKYPVVAEVWLFLGIAHDSHNGLHAAANALRSTPSSARCRSGQNALNQTPRRPDRVAARIRESNRLALDCEVPCSGVIAPANDERAPGLSVSDPVTS